MIDQRTHDEIKKIKELDFAVQTLFLSHNIPEIKKFINSGHKWNWNAILGHACFVGNLEVINLVIDKGGNDWEHGLQRACDGYHPEIIELMTTKNEVPYDNVLAYGCKTNNYKVIKFALKKHANNYKYALHNAAMCGDEKIINLMIRKGGGQDWGLDYGLTGACQENNFKSAKYLIKKGAKNFNQALDMAIIANCEDFMTCMGIEKIIMKENNLKIIRLLIKHRADIKLITHDAEVDLDEFKKYLIEVGYIKHKKIKLNKKILLKDLRNELNRYINYL